MKDALLDLKSDFACEALDLAQLHLVWAARHLQDRRHGHALQAFSSMLTAVRAVAGEMAEIRRVIDGDKLTGEAAAEYRADRERRERRAAA